MEIPAIGFGTYKLQGELCVESVRNALEMGYRHIDTADRYKNHREVARGIKESGLKREDLFITSKIAWNKPEADSVKSDTERFLNELQTDYIDLLLIHWPSKVYPVLKTVLAMNELKKKGLIKSIGISNFTKPMIESLLAQLRELPEDISIDNHQFEFHPSLQQNELIEYCLENNITISAYSPLAQGQDLNLELIQEIAKKHGASEAQIILAWIRQRGIISLPRSSKEKNIRNNLESLSITLSNDDIQSINALNIGNRLIKPGFAPF